MCSHPAGQPGGTAWHTPLWRIQPGSPTVPLQSVAQTSTPTPKLKSFAQTRSSRARRGTATEAGSASPPTAARAVKRTKAGENCSERPHAHPSAAADPSQRSIPLELAGVLVSTVSLSDLQACFGMVRPWGQGGQDSQGTRWGGSRRSFRRRRAPVPPPHPSLLPFLPHTLPCLCPSLSSRAANGEGLHQAGRR